MTLPKIFRRKSTYIVAGILAALVAIVLFYQGKANQIAYETAAVERRDLQQTVEVTGEIKPAERMDLSFQNSGKVKTVNAKVGSMVMAGDILATLEGSDVIFTEKNARAALSAAQANLNARAAGETSQSIRVSETQVEQAQASYSKAVRDLEATRRTTADTVQSATVALGTAQNNLNNSGAIAEQNIANAYAAARTSLATALGPLQTALTDGDQITGVDNTAANATYVSLLGVTDLGSMERAKNSYRVAKDAKLAAERLVNSLSTASSKDQIQAAADSLQIAIGLVQTYLTDVQKVLAASLTSSNFTTTELTTKKTIIDA
ncbi:MAG: biotin/lipoyl-binding protein, partial [Alphaproteobacteria bacterium]|nr:biotin/lipoyl-binding protein [Alphaproteobacteria bacterium]